MPVSTSTAISLPSGLIGCSLPSGLIGCRAVIAEPMRRPA
jgi:hypothetical protein